jgi:hypothetical protein
MASSKPTKAVGVDVRVGTGFNVDAGISDGTENTVCITAFEKGLGRSSPIRDSGGPFGWLDKAGAAPSLTQSNKLPADLVMPLFSWA